MEAKSWEFNSLGEDSSLLRRVHMEDFINAKQTRKMAILTTLVISYIYAMTRLIKDGFCIKMTFMHNDCWVNNFEKCSRH